MFINIDTEKLAKLRGVREAKDDVPDVPDMPDAPTTISPEENDNADTKEDDTDNTVSDDNPDQDTENDDETQMEEPEPEPIVSEDKINIIGMYDKFVELRDLLAKLQKNFYFVQSQGKDNYAVVLKTIENKLLSLNMILNSDFNADRLNDYQDLYKSHMQALKTFNDILQNTSSQDSLENDR